MNWMTRVLAQGQWEVRTTLRNGEQLLLVLGIPILLMLVGTWVPSLGMSPRTDGIAAILTASLLACCFTSVAIATAFERRAAALTFLATTPLGRSGLLVGKFLAVIVVSSMSAGTVIAAAALLGWRPSAPVAGQLALILTAYAVGAVTFTAWGVLLAGLMRAEAVLAVANGVFLMLIFLGGVAIPLSALPVAWTPVAQVLPTEALLQAVRDQGAIGALATLALWAALGVILAVRLFRWDDRRS